MRPVPLGLIGPRAEKILAEATGGSVCSSHDTGLYCRFGKSVLLLHDADYGLIPFGLGCETPPASGWKEYVPGTAVGHDAKRKILTLNGEEYAYFYAETPSSLLAGLPSEMLTLERLHAGIEASLPLLGTEGIAAHYFAERCSLFGTAPRSSPFADMWEEALWEPLRNCIAWCSGDTNRSPGGVAAALIGLGPGLTPLGDDILCGLLSGAHMLGEIFPCDALSRIIDTLAPESARALSGATTCQSAAFLESAASGERFGMLDAVITSLLAQQPPGTQKAFELVSAVGHTSGSGLLLGLLCATTLADG